MVLDLKVAPPEVRGLGIQAQKLDCDTSSKAASSTRKGCLPARVARAFDATMAPPWVRAMAKPTSPNKSLAHSCDNSIASVSSVAAPAPSSTQHQQIESALESQQRQSPAGSPSHHSGGSAHKVQSMPQPADVAEMYVSYYRFDASPSKKQGSVDELLGRDSTSSSSGAASKRAASKRAAALLSASPAAAARPNDTRSSVGKRARGGHATSGDGECAEIRQLRAGHVVGDVVDDMEYDIEDMSFNRVGPDAASRSPRITGASAADAAAHAVEAAFDEALLHIADQSSPTATSPLCPPPQDTTHSPCTLQHTATHCNTLQHTATHCNTFSSPLCPPPQDTTYIPCTLQHTATASGAADAAVRTAVQRGLEHAGSVLRDGIAAALHTGDVGSVHQLIDCAFVLLIRLWARPEGGTNLASTSASLSAPGGAGATEAECSWMTSTWSAVVENVLEQLGPEAAWLSHVAATHKTTLSVVER